MALLKEQEINFQKMVTNKSNKREGKMKINKIIFLIVTLLFGYSSGYSLDINGIPYSVTTFDVPVLGEIKIDSSSSLGINDIGQVTGTVFYNPISEEYTGFIFNSYSNSYNFPSPLQGDYLKRIKIVDINNNGTVAFNKTYLENTGNGIEISGYIALLFNINDDQYIDIKERAESYFFGINNFDIAVGNDPLGDYMVDGQNNLIFVTLMTR